MVVMAIERNFSYFLNNDFSKYEDGEWIAIAKNRVVAHGKSLKAVMKNAEKKTKMRPLFTKVKKTAHYLHG